MAKTGIRAPRVQTEAPLEDLRGMHEQGRCYVPAVSTDYWSFSSIGTIKSNGWIFPALVGTCKGERVPGDGGTQGPTSTLLSETPVQLMSTSFQATSSVEKPGDPEVQAGCWPRILTFWKKDKKRLAAPSLELPQEASIEQDPSALVRLGCHRCQHITHPIFGLVASLRSLVRVG